MKRVARTSHAPEPFVGAGGDNGVVHLHRVSCVGVRSFEDKVLAWNLIFLILVAAISTHEVTISILKKIYINTGMNSYISITIDISYW